MNSYLNKSLAFDQHLLQTPLKECGEKMVNLELLCERAEISIMFAAKNTYYLRQSVAKSFLKAAEDFNSKGYMICMEDAYRSLSRQKEKFLQKVADLKAEYPKKSLLQLKQMANTYVAGIPILAAHTAGAAVDVTLYTKSGRLIDMGCPYHTLDERAVTDNPEFTKEVMDNRKFFRNTLEQYGFVNYPFEYWHYSIGDVCAAYITHQQAVYAPLEFNTVNNVKEAIHTQKELFSFFKE